MATNTKQNKPATLDELADGIVAELKKNNGQVSEPRAHSVETHLRAALRGLGYKPAESDTAKAGIPDLADQFAAALDAEGGEAKEETHDHIHSSLSCVLSNLKAEGVLKEAPQLKVAPLKTVKNGPAMNNSVRDELGAKPYQELVAIATELNKELPDDKKITVAPNMKKDALVTAILVARDYTP